MSLTGKDYRRALRARKAAERIADIEELRRIWTSRLARRMRSSEGRQGINYYVTRSRSSSHV